MKAKQLKPTLRDAIILEPLQSLARPDRQNVAIDTLFPLRGHFSLNTFKAPSEWEHCMSPQPCVCVLILSLTISETLGKSFLFQFVCLFYIPHISKTMWYLSFSAWFIWLSTILTISIHVVLNGKISLLGLFGWSFTLGVCGQEAVAPYLFSLSVKRYAQGLWYRLWQIYHSREISYQVYLIFKI